VVVTLRIWVSDKHIGRCWWELTAQKPWPEGSRTRVFTLEQFLINRVTFDRIIAAFNAILFFY